MVERLEEKANKSEEDVETETPKTSKSKPEKSIIEKATENTMVRQVGRTIFKELTRGLLGALGVGGKKKKGWF